MFFASRENENIDVAIAYNIAKNIGLELQKLVGAFPKNPKHNLILQC